MAHHLTQDDGDIINSFDINALEARVVNVENNILFTDIIKFKINGAYEYSGLTNIGSAKSITKSNFGRNI